MPQAERMLPYMEAVVDGCLAIANTGLLLATPTDFSLWVYGILAGFYGVRAVECAFKMFKKHLFCKSRDIPVLFINIVLLLVFVGAASFGRLKVQSGERFSAAAHLIGICIGFLSFSLSAQNHCASDTGTSRSSARPPSETGAGGVAQAQLLSSTVRERKLEVKGW